MSPPATEGTHRILGIDPGLTRCGFGIIDGDRSRRTELVTVGVLRTPSELDIARRLLQLETGLEEIITTHRPDRVAVEQVFAQHNAMTVIGTAQAAGVAMLVAARHGLPVHLHTPSEVKAAVTGSGTAHKAQVGAMVARILRLEAKPTPADAADAAALAICHLWRGAGQAALTGGAAVSGAAEAPANRWQQAAAAHAARAPRSWKDVIS